MNIRYYILLLSFIFSSISLNAMEKIPANRRIESMINHAKADLESIKQFSYWHNLDMVQVRETCEQQLYMRFDATRDSAFEYRDAIFGRNWLHQQFLVTVWETLYELNNSDTVSTELLLNNIDEAYLHLWIRFTKMVSMPDAFINAAVKKFVAPEQFIIAHHTELLRAFFDNRAKTGKLIPTELIIAFNYLDSLKTLAEIFTTMSPSNQRLPKTQALDTVLLRHIEKLENDGEALNTIRFNNQLGDIRTVSEAEFNRIVNVFFINKASCAYCHSSPEKLRLCGGCRKVRYCNPTCQKNDWAKHKTACQSLR